MSRGVLIVDDDQFIRKLIATTLEDVSEFELHEAADGVEALEVARQPALGRFALELRLPIHRPGVERLVILHCLCHLAVTACCVHTSYAVILAG